MLDKSCFCWRKLRKKKCFVICRLSKSGELIQHSRTVGNIIAHVQKYNVLGGFFPSPSDGAIDCFSSEVSVPEAGKTEMEV